MSDAKLFTITGFGGGLSIGLQADSYDEFVALAKQVYGEAEGEVFANEAFGGLRRLASPGAEAVGVVRQGLGPVSVVSSSPAPNVVPMPGTAPQAVPAGGIPPGVEYPGDCAHGRREFKNTIARGKPWPRFECALPWSKGADNSQRCKPVNL